MRSFFEPTAAPPWLRQVLSSIRAALGDIWPAPLRLKDYATAELPAAAEFGQGLVYDSTSQVPKYSNGAAWANLIYTDENARDAIGAALVAGANITIAVNDPGDTITISAPASYTDENARDAIGAALVAGANITIAVNDPGDTITISAAASYTDENARDAIGAALVAGPGASIAVNDPGDTITLAGAHEAIATGAAGAGAFTPSSAQKGAFAMGQLRVGACELFRFDEPGGAWELRWGFWTGTAITRPTNGFVASSTGSALSLSANASVTILSPLGLFQRGRAETVGQLIPNWGSSGLTSSGMVAMVVEGTAGFVNFVDTNLLTRNQAIQYTSATTANGSAGIRSATSVTTRNTGWHFSGRIGATQLPVGPRFYMGMCTSLGALAAEPSAFTDMTGFGKDSTDTNIQFMVNDASGTASKTDTGIALAINTLYEVNTWCDPGGSAVSGLLVDYTNQALWYGSFTSNLPTMATIMSFRSAIALNGTNTGTAAIFRLCDLYLRTGT